MIKFRKGNLLGFGLSEENIKRLKEGKPILVNLDEMGIPNCQLAIFYGETEATMVQSLAPFIDFKTRIIGDADL